MCDHLANTDEEYQHQVEMENNLNIRRSLEAMIDGLFCNKNDYPDESISNVTQRVENIKLTEPLNELNNNSSDEIEIQWKDIKYECFTDLTADGGIKKQILKSGEGNTSPKYGNKVYLRYTSYLQVGNSVQPFDKSNDNVFFALGKGAVIQGLDIGIATMKKNEISLFIIQPEYGYGHTGNASHIAANAVVIFEVKLLDWKLEDLSPQKNEKILRQILQKGEIVTYPNEGSNVTIDICGTYKDEVIENRTVSFLLGEGFNAQISEGVEIALLKFRLKEKSLLYIKGQYAFELQPKINEPLNEDSVVEYEVTLQSFEKAKEVWEMNSDEKYENSTKAKEKGICYFQNGNYKLASKQFRKIIIFLENEPGITPDLVEPRKMLLLSAYLNEALCQMKLRNLFDAAKACTKALQIDFKNEKALYRRGQCYLSVNDWDEALKDFQAVLEINPKNSASKKLIPVCLSKINEQKTKDKNTYSNMFQKYTDHTEIRVKIQEEEQVIEMID